MLIAASISGLAIAVRAFIYRGLLSTEPRTGTVLDFRKAIVGGFCVDVRANLGNSNLVVVPKLRDLNSFGPGKGDNVDVWMLPNRPGLAFLFKPSLLDLVTSVSLVGLFIFWILLLPFLFYMKGTVSG